MKVKIYKQLVILAVWLLAICPSFVYAQVRGQSAAVSNPGSTNKPANPDANDVKTETEVPKADQPDRHFSTRREVMTPVNNQRFNRRPVNHNRPLNSRIIPGFNNRVRPMQNNMRFEQASQRMQPIRRLKMTDYDFKKPGTFKVPVFNKERPSLNQAFKKMDNSSRADSQVSPQFMRLAQANSIAKELNSGFNKMAKLHKQPVRAAKGKFTQMAKLQPSAMARPSTGIARPSEGIKSYLKMPDWKNLKDYRQPDFSGFVRKQPKQRQIMIAGLKAKGANVAKLQVLDKWVTSYERLSETSQKAVFIMLKTGHVNDMSILIDAEQARVDLEQRTTDVNNLIAQGDNILEQFIVEEINLTLEPIYPVFEGITAINSGLPMPALIPVIGN